MTMHNSIRNTEILTIGLDARWFLALKEIKRPLLLKSLTLDEVDLEKARKEFAEDDSRNPTFGYPNLDGALIAHAIVKISDLRREVCQKESVSSIRLIYDLKLEEILWELQLLKGSATGNWELFKHSNRQIYGGFADEVLTPIISSLKHRYDYFPDLMIGDSKDNLPLESTIQEARQYLRGLDIMADEQVTYSSHQIASLWKAKLDGILPHWQVAVDSSARQILVSNRMNIVHIPAHAEMDGKKLRKLFVHEIGTHVYRREQGKSSSLQLLSIGLPGYQRAEEGIAMVQEQLLQKRVSHFGGHDKYLAIAIATGAVDGHPKDFKDTYAFLRSYFEKRHTKRHDVSKAMELAQNRAWELTVRIFRGGNPTLPGCCFMKDKIYREGNRYIWGILETHPEYFAHVFAGKFDPGNSTHRNLVVEYSRESWGSMGGRSL